MDKDGILSMDNGNVGGEEIVFSVSEFLDYWNQVFAIREARVLGEVTGAQVHPSGFYFSLKDKIDGSVLNCYMSPWKYKGLGFVLEDGMEVRVFGLPNIYKPKGKFSFVTQEIELAGEGTLKKAYELLKKKLDEEGFYARKRAIPEFIQNIAVITSRTGAVIDDFRKNLDALGFKVFLYDARVEGAKAVQDVMGGIRFFQRFRQPLDVLVVIRGGGSLEDLQAFNDERVVREIFASRIPTICGIGHDRDVPIACLVSDVATSTPTAAAVLINHSWERARGELLAYEHGIFHSFQSVILGERFRLRDLSGRLFGFFERLLMRYFILSQKLMDQVNFFISKNEGVFIDIRRLLDLLFDVFSRNIAYVFTALTAFESVLKEADPQRNLRLGYSILTTKMGKVVRGSHDVKEGEIVFTKFYHGSMISKVEEVLDDAHEKANKQ